MSDLFGTSSEPFLDIEMPGATLRFAAQFLPSDIADRYFKILLKETLWREEEVLVWGKRHKQPRLVAWHGDAGTKYTYSGSTLNPAPWTPSLLELREKVEVACGARFNSVLLNQYRNNNDSMGWHSDNEPELGKMPTIASLSLGDSRVFLFKHRTEKNLGIRRITLNHGSVLIMSGETQRNWLHAIDKEKKPSGIRINLTFRLISEGRDRDADSSQTPLSILRSMAFTV
jgi:alkylated DNA repair dioxygenase AlkB